MSSLMLELSTRRAAYLDRILEYRCLSPQPLVAVTIAAAGKDRFSVSVCPESKIPHHLDFLAISPCSLTEEWRHQPETMRPPRPPRRLVLDRAGLWSCLQAFADLEHPAVAVSFVIRKGTHTSERSRILQLIKQHALGGTLWSGHSYWLARFDACHSQGCGIPYPLGMADLTTFYLRDGQLITVMMRRAAFQFRKIEFNALTNVLSVIDLPSGFITTTACQHLFPRLRPSPLKQALFAVDTIAQNVAGADASNDCEIDDVQAEETEGEMLSL